MFGLLDQKSYINEASNAPELSLSKSEISFENVTLSYEGQKNSALKEINLNVPHGKTTALVGPSGSGKTSLLDLLIGLYEPIDGNIKINDYSLSELKYQKTKNYKD